MKDRKEQWAARWTWAHFTAGVHSTQRAESIHAVIKKFLGATTLLTALAEKLVRQRVTIDGNRDLKVAKDALKATTHGMQSHLPAVQALVNEVSTHAADILRAQEAQILPYTVSRMGVMPTGATWYQAIHNSITDPPALAGSVAEDYGLPTPTSTRPKIYTHRVTLSHEPDGASRSQCTCQFPTCWGLPCRHMLAVTHALQHKTLPRDVVAAHWRTITDKEAEDKMRTLLRTAPGEVAAAAPRPMTQQERYAYCSAESKAVVELAASSPEAMELFVKCLDDCKDKLRALQPVLPEASTAGPSVHNPPTTHTSGKPQSKRRKAAHETLGA